MRDYNYVVDESNPDAAYDPRAELSLDPLSPAERAEADTVTQWPKFAVTVVRSVLSLEARQIQSVSLSIKYHPR